MCDGENFISSIEILLKISIIASYFRGYTTKLLGVQISSVRFSVFKNAFQNKMNEQIN